MSCFIPNNTNVFRLSGGIISQNARPVMVILCYFFMLCY
nr:MAG TPA: hypothetical protein [Bacteriophage sp.]